jgi:hypothetical protein
MTTMMMMTMTMTTTTTTMTMTMTTTTTTTQTYREDALRVGDVGFEIHVLIDVVEGQNRPVLVIMGPLNLRFEWNLV